MKATIRTEVEVELTPEQIGRLFADLDSDAQAKFFAAVAARGDEWDKENGADALSFGQWWQWNEIGVHLYECECATDGAREVIRNIMSGMESAEGKLERSQQVQSQPESSR